jgi:hypothetical protein
MFGNAAWFAPLSLTVEHKVDPSLSRADRKRLNRQLLHLLRSVVLGSDERAGTHCPNRGLRAVVDPNLSKDCFDMNLYGGLGDGHLARDGLIGITVDQAAKDRVLPKRQPRRVTGLGL